MSDEGLEGRLALEVERRLAAQQAMAEAALEARTAREERDVALKMVTDQHAGVAKLLTQVQVQGARIDELSGRTSALFNFGDYPLHSGGRSNFKIDCDHLSDGDLEALAALAASWYQWSYVLGIDTGGSRFASVLAQYNTKDESDPRMIVDDVLTTGASMEAERLKLDPNARGESFGLVIFARTQPAEWIRPLFQFAAPSNGGSPRA